MRYEMSRHNAGFLVLDQLARQHHIPVQQTIFEAQIGKGLIDGNAAYLAKPQTFMNRSGISVGKLMSYFRIDMEDAVVVHDDLDLPFGTIRLKKGGGHGGHKGLISLIEHLGGADFYRVRFGIGRPPRKEMVEGYVLSPFSAEELPSLPALLGDAAEAVRDILLSGIAAAMDKHHKKRQTVPEEEP
jgi:peptidyl-tRNA hydrolase, PTH1 family